MTGTFGRVYFGMLLGSENDTALERPILVKTVTGQ